MAYYYHCLLKPMPTLGSYVKLLDKLGFEFTHHELYPPTGLDHPSFILIKDKFLQQNK